MTKQYLRKSLIVIFIIFSFFSLRTPDVVYAQSNQSNGIQVDLGVQGVAVCNNNGICESNIGETPTNCSSDCFIPPTPTPSSGGGGNGGSSQRPAKDTTPPQNPTNVQAFANLNGIALLWLNPPDEDFSYIRIMRNEDHFYGDPFLGTLIYEGNGQYFFDTNVTAGARYFYTLFSRDRTGNFSGGSAVSAVAFSFIKIPTPPTPPMVDFPIFLLPKYIVHQWNQKDQTLSDVISAVVNGNNSITIDTERVEHVNDYLAVTGVKKEFLGQYMFSFNQDSGRYQSVIPPLFAKGIYDVKIYRYKNNMPVIISEGLLNVKENIVPTTGESSNNIYMNYYLYIIILFLILLLLLFLLKRRRKTEENRNFS